MRKKLKEIGSDNRNTFTGTFVRFGYKNGWKGPIETLLLKDIRQLNGEIVAEHLWFTKTKGFANLDLKEGDILKFNARVSVYEKGYKGYDFMKQLENPVSKDYKLSYPTKIEIISREVRADV